MRLRFVIPIVVLLVAAACTAESTSTTVPSSMPTTTSTAGSRNHNDNGTGGCYVHDHDCCVRVDHNHWRVDCGDTSDRGHHAGARGCCRGIRAARLLHLISWSRLRCRSAGPTLGSRRWRRPCRSCSTSGIGCRLEANKVFSGSRSTPSRPSSSTSTTPGATGQPSCPSSRWTASRRSLTRPLSVSSWRCRSPRAITTAG